MTTGTSSGPAFRKRSARSAVLRDRAEVAATARDTWASSASSMLPWCYGAERAARPRGTGPDAPRGGPYAVRGVICS